MIVLLNKNSLTAKDRFMADKMALNLNERQSTATLTVGPRAPQVTVGDWLMDEEEPGKGIVWRVKTIDQQFETLVRTIQLEHAINTLRDTVMFGDVTTKTLANDKKATTCSALKALQYILGKQSVWKLGTVAFTDSNPYSFNGDDLYSAIETISSSLEDCEWTFDFSSYPFTLNIVKRATAFSCEMRVDRNLRTLRRTIDRSRMYTRIYPIGQNNIHIDGDCLKKNENLYGTISKVQTDNGIKTAGELKAWAQHLLNRHCEPTVTVTISGMEFYQTTGEALDRLAIGKVCRVPIPELETTIIERITKLSWSDKVSSPEEVTVTLANEVEDVTSIVSTLAKSSGKSGKTKAKKDGEDHAWVVDTETHVGMVAEALAGEGADKDWSRVSSIMVDGQGITSQVQTVQDGVVKAQSSITQHDDFIDATVKAIGKNGKVTAASIVASVNASGSKVKISADKIELAGEVLLNDVLRVMSKQATFIYPVAFRNGASGNVTVGIVPKEGAVAASSFSWNKANSPTVKVDYDALMTMVQKAETTGGGSTLKLTLFDGTVINFNKATTLSGAWSGSKWTVTAVPQGDKLSIGFSGSPDVPLELVTNGTPTLNALNSKWVDAPMKVQELNGQSEPTSRYTVTKTIDATAAWNDGQSTGYSSGVTAGKNATKVTGPTWSTTPASGITGNSNTATFTTDAPSPTASAPKSLYLVMDQDTFNSSGNKYVYVHHTDSTDGTRIARVQVSAGNLTVTEKIATYGNTYPTSVDGGNISKSGITTGKYMTMKVKMANKETTIRFLVVA